MVEGNWKSATLNETALVSLVQQEVSEGFVAEWSGSLEDARRAWPTGVAKGKLSVARSLGKADRLILDTTVSGVNPQAIIPEKTAVPGPYDVRQYIRPDPDRGRVDLVIDVAKAHKRVRLNKHDQGLMLFEAAGKLYHYLVCHFGGAFSDFWWKRVAALVMDVVHNVIWLELGGHVYVDD